MSFRRGPFTIQCLTPLFSTSAVSTAQVQLKRYLRRNLATAHIFKPEDERPIHHLDDWNRKFRQRPTSHCRPCKPHSNRERVLHLDQEIIDASHDSFIWPLAPRYPVADIG